MKSLIILLNTIFFLFYSLYLQNSSYSSETNYNSDSGTKFCYKDNGLYKLGKKKKSILDTPWGKKGVSKIEMKNPNTGNYDEILMLNGGRYIEIRDDKDVKISDIHLFSLIFGRENLLYYNYAEFVNGKIQSTSIPQTKFYRGRITLKNTQNGSEMDGEAGVYFMEGNGKRLVEIANDICKCYIRIYYSDQIGMRIYND